MAKRAWANKADANQEVIIKQLRDLGMTVAPRHDDIIVGYGGKNYWFELKNPDGLFLKDGVTFASGKIKKGQGEIRKTWLGQYDIVWELSQILDKIGFNKVIKT